MPYSKGDPKTEKKTSVKNRGNLKKAQNLFNNNVSILINKLLQIYHTNVRY